MASRDIGVFLRDVIRKAPTPFPYIAGFHLLMLLYVLIYWWGLPISYYYIEILWTLGFTISWLYICDLKRWACYSYIALTVANLVLFGMSLNMTDRQMEAFQRAYVSALLLPALIFCFFILFFFRRLKEGAVNNNVNNKIDAP